MQSVFRCLVSSRELLSCVSNFSPAMLTTGQHTCISTLVSYSEKRNMHTKSQHLLVPNSCLLQQTCTIRRIYPDPFEKDLEYYLPPKEDVNLDLNYVPVLGNKGKDIVGNIEAAASTGDLGRLFAVVHIGGKQRKVTTEDMVLINGFFPPQIGDKIRLEKVMLVGGRDFTLFGRPLVDRNVARVEATVIEKTLSHIKVDFTKHRRFRRLKLLQTPQTVLVINSIDVDTKALQ